RTGRSCCPELAKNYLSIQKLSRPIWVDSCESAMSNGKTGTIQSQLALRIINYVALHVLFLFVQFFSFPTLYRRIFLQTPVRNSDLSLFVSVRPGSRSGMNSASLCADLFPNRGG